MVVPEVIDKADVGERLLEKIAHYLNQRKTSSRELPATSISDTKDKKNHLSSPRLNAQCVVRPLLPTIALEYG